MHGDFAIRFNGQQNELESRIRIHFHREVWYKDFYQYVRNGFFWLKAAK